LFVEKSKNRSANSGIEGFAVDLNVDFWCIQVGNLHSRWENPATDIPRHPGKGAVGISHGRAATGRQASGKQASGCRRSAGCFGRNLFGGWESTGGEI